LRHSADVLTDLQVHAHADERVFWQGWRHAVWAEPATRGSRLTDMTWLPAPSPRLTLLAATVPLFAGCISPVTGDRAGEASCAAVIVYGGVTYWGHGELKRDPATTGRHVTGMIPSCDDSGGQEPPERDEAVHVAELVDVPLETAFRWGDSIFIREGRELPAATRVWFRAPRCTTSTEFELVADWVGVTGPRRPRFDGDLRPPYRLQVHVTKGPDEYVGATIAVHADAATDPTLGPEDVKASLWQGGQVIARVKCDAGRFQALSLRVPSQQ